MALGTILLIGMAVGGIAYALILHQESIYRDELIRTVLLQGRNVALSSEKFLLRSDPEFELFPLAKRLVRQNQDVLDVTFPAASGKILGGRELARIGKPFEGLPKEVAEVAIPDLRLGEKLYEDDRSFLYVGPVLSAGNEVGRVILRYDKRSISAALRRAVIITLLCAAGAFLSSILLSILLFRHISSPMEALLRGVRALARGEWHTSVRVNSKNEFRVLAESFNEMARQLLEDQKQLVAKERMERELELAHDIQSTLLPRELPQPEGWEIATVYHPAQEVGGDYVDVIPLGGGRYALVMADVAGKGVPGLVVMAMLKAIVESQITVDPRPIHVVRSLHRQLKSKMKRHMFVTLFYGVLDTKTSTLTFSNAGHMPLAIYDSIRGRSRFFQMEGMPLGIVPTEVFERQLQEYTLTLNPADLVLQYTDGLTESQNDRGEQFGFERLKVLVDRYAPLGAGRLIQKLVQVTATFRGPGGQSDDLTLLAVRRQPQKVPTGELEEEQAHATLA
jgi:sigma-B regulation protein RsbU (phosphoserine phosphatase)